MNGVRLRLLALPLVLVGGAVLSGCVLAPGEAANQARLAKEQGEPYRKSFDQRELPEVSADATWRQILRRSLLANGDIESAYFEWRASVERIDVEAGWPNANVQLGFDYMFSDDMMKSWDRTTVTGGFDPMLMNPAKTYAMGKVATAEAVGKGNAFRAAKFKVQEEVLRAYIDYALMAEKVRIARANLDLLKLIADTASARFQGGGTQQDYLRADIEYRMAEDELRDMEAELPPMRAMLNALMGRDVTAPLDPPPSLPEQRPLASDDAALLALAVNQNPELATVAADVQGRTNALEVARLAFLPDFSPVAGLTGDVSRFLGAMLSVPTTIPQLRAAVKEARSMLRAAQSMQRQAKLETGAEFVAALSALRNAERQVELFQKTILPAAEQVLESAQRGHTVDQVMFMDLIETQRTLLEAKQTVAEARAERERRLAQIERLTGVDAETTVAATEQGAQQ